MYVYIHSICSICINYVDGSGEESKNIFIGIFCIYLGEFLCHSICIYIILLVIYKMI